MPAFKPLLVLLHVSTDLWFFRLMCLLPTCKMVRSQSRGFIIYHFSSLCLTQSQARCLVDWKRASWGEEKLMYIHILTNKLSREALKSDLLWIGLAAIWTQTVVVRSLDYQRSHCQSFCCAWADKCRRKSCLLSWEACKEQYHSCFCFFATKHQWLKPSQGPCLWVLWQMPLVPMLVTSWELVTGRQSYFDKSWGIESFTAYA